VALHHVNLYTIDYSYDACTQLEQLDAVDCFVLMLMLPSPLLLRMT
jgi:hypothetical protein